MVISLPNFSVVEESVLMDPLSMQGMENDKQIAKRQSTIRKIDRSLKKCDDLEVHILPWDSM